uniref:Uncharacterized protein n=1 Tax=Lygus hesperus TaxID=30085 RepID=A0A146LXP1_LYGHE
MVDAPSLVHGSEHISSNHLIADKTKISEELMIMGLTVGQPPLLVVAMPVKWLLAFGADEMLNVPMFSQSCDNSFFNRTSACATDRNSHFIVAPQTVQFIQIIGSIARPAFHFSGIRVQLNPASSAIEVVRVVHFPAEFQRFVVNETVALVTAVLLVTASSCISATVVAESLPIVTHKSQLGQFFIAALAPEAAGVPIGVHSLDDPSDDEISAFAATRCKENVEVVFAILPPFKLVEGSIWEGSEALSTHEALCMPEVSRRVDDLLMRLKPLPAPGAGHVTQRHVIHIVSLFRLFIFGRLHVLPLLFRDGDGRHEVYLVVVDGLRNDHPFLFHPPEEQLGVVQRQEVHRRRRQVRVPLRHVQVRRGNIRKKWGNKQRDNPFNGSSSKSTRVFRIRLFFREHSTNRRITRRNERIATDWGRQLIWNQQGMNSAIQGRQM